MGGCFHGASATVDAAIIRGTIVHRFAGHHMLGVALSAAERLSRPRISETSRALTKFFSPRPVGSDLVITT